MRNTFLVCLGVCSWLVDQYNWTQLPWKCSRLFAYGLILNILFQYFFKKWWLTNTKIKLAVLFVDVNMTCLKLDLCMNLYFLAGQFRIWSKATIKTKNFWLIFAYNAVFACWVRGQLSSLRVVKTLPGGLRQSPGQNPLQLKKPRLRDL